MTFSEVAPVRANSTLLATLAYDAAESILQLEFCDGSVYRYFAVPQAVYRGLLTAASQGSYFNHQIRNDYLYALLRCPK